MGNFKHVVKNNLAVLSQVYGIYPAFIYASLLATITRIATPVTTVLGLKLMIDSLCSGKPVSYTCFLVLLYGGIGGTAAAVNAWYNNWYMPRARTVIQGAVNRTLMQKTASLDLSCFEDPDFYDKYVRAINEANNRAMAVVATLTGLFGNFLSLLALVVIIASMEPVMIGAAVLGVLITFFIDMHKSRMLYRFEMERIPFLRRLSYIQRIFYEPQYAKELRLFGFTRPAMGKYSRQVAELSGMMNSQGRRLFRVTAFEGILNQGIFIIAVVTYLAIRVAAGAISVGSFSALVNGTFQLGNELGGLVGKIPELYQHSLFIDNYFAVIRRKPSIEGMKGVAVDSSRAHGLELRNVSYRYQGSKEAALKNISIKISAGEHIAVVGYNGAGKSTLIKLLMRLYDPDEGEILLDGINLKDIDVEALRKSYGVVVQDFQHYAFTIAENILPGFCDDSREKVVKALEESGLYGKVSTLPNDIDTPLTREFDSNGIMLSGGEMQKLALARAFVRSSGILILDEPSSALDPKAEHELFSKVMEWAKGRTAIFISHRLSTARLADRIILMENGSVAEEGTHEELMALNNKYAGLYRLQSMTYKF